MTDLDMANTTPPISQDRASPDSEFSDCPIPTIAEIRARRELTDATESAEESEIIPLNPMNDSPSQMDASSSTESGYNTMVDNGGSQPVVAMVGCSEKVSVSSCSPPPTITTQSSSGYTVDNLHPTIRTQPPTSRTDTCRRFAHGVEQPLRKAVVAEAKDTARMRFDFADICISAGVQDQKYLELDTSK